MSKLETALLIFALIPWSLIGAGAFLLLRHFLGGKSESAKIAHDAFGFLKAATLEEKARVDYLAAQPPKIDLGPLAKQAASSMTAAVLAGKVVKDANGEEWQLA